MSTKKKVDKSPFVMAQIVPSNPSNSGAGLMVRVFPKFDATADTSFEVFSFLSVAFSQRLQALGFQVNDVIRIEAIR